MAELIMKTMPGISIYRLFSYELNLREPFSVCHLTITQAKCVWTQSGRAFHRLNTFFVCMAFHRLWYRQIYSREAESSFLLDNSEIKNDCVWISM